jgi:cardiolipin synthase
MVTVLYSLLLALIPLLGLAGAGHALLYKRDPRAAFGWIAVCLMFPLVGPLLYFLFGVNRVQTRARELSARYPFRLVGYERGESRSGVPVVEPTRLPAQWQPLGRISGHLLQRPLLEGNDLEPLHNGEETYPAMLAAIEAAETRVWLATYIFETNFTGRRFIDALARAQARGVDVRVLLDGVGELYSLPWAGTLLRQSDVRVARFMRPRIWPPQFHVNLRNHRKILLVDADVAFVGGMNIGDRHLAADETNAGRVIDVQFRLRGPVVSQVAEIFAEDWRFSTGELTQPPSPSEVGTFGDHVCRAFSDGPNEDLDRLALIMAGTISAARERIDIMTPYFIPSPSFISALEAAWLRGVRITILLPERSNLKVVHWATRNMLWQLLHMGIEVRYQPPPFVHTKLFSIDGHYTIIGSANIDPRSLRLNFELSVEVFSESFAQRVQAHCDEVSARSRPVTLQEVDDRSLPVRVRDAVCWLFSPYL